MDSLPLNTERTRQPQFRQGGCRRGDHFYRAVPRASAPELELAAPAPVLRGGTTRHKVLGWLTPVTGMPASASSNLLRGLRGLLRGDGHRIAYPGEAVEDEVDAKAKAKDPKSRLWPFGEDDASRECADDARNKERPARLPPEHAGEHDPEQSRNNPDNAEQKGEFDRSCKWVGQKDGPGCDVQRPKQEVENKALPSYRAKRVDDLEDPDNHEGPGYENSADDRGKRHVAKDEGAADEQNDA